MENAVTKREKISYGLYFMGQNVFYGLIGYMTTYFTDIGITAALVAIVALITKVWDAINDPIFGMIMDKVNFKKGKFLPWLRFSHVRTADQGYKAGFIICIVFHCCLFSSFISSLRS